MTITEMHSWFKLILDKYDTPYYTSTEIDTFINRAMSNWVNQNVFVRREEQEGLVIKSASEFSSNWETLVQPLIHADISVMSSTNLLALSTIEAALSSGTRVNAILAVLDPNGYDVEWLRYNDYGTAQRNYFTRPNSDYRAYRVTKDGLLLSPASNAETFKVSVLRTPTPVSLSTPTNCELPLITHEKIMAMAVDLAKFPTGDESVGGISQITV